MSDSPREVLARIAAVDPVHAQTLADARGELHEEPLSFYRAHRLVRARVQLPTATMEFRYADDGRRVLPLMTAADVERVNAAERLQLKETECLPYLRFYLACSSGLRWLDGDSDVPWTPAGRADAAWQARVARRIHRAEVAPGGNGRHMVSLCAIDRRSLVQLFLEVTPAGAVRLATRIVLEEELPVTVPESRNTSALELPVVRKRVQRPPGT